jgi:Na+/glutamate symporter
MGQVGTPPLNPCPVTALTALTTSLLPHLLHPASAGLVLPPALWPGPGPLGPAMAWIAEGLTSLNSSLPILALSLALLALLLLLGTGLGRLLGTHQWGIPEALLAGGLGLLIAPAGALPLIPPAVIQLWDQLPLILLTLVFASLLLGKPLPAIGGLWRPLSAQMLLALTLAFGQYLVAALAVLLLLQPLMGAPSVMACLIEVAYEGGHGSAAAMGPTYARLGLESGEALGLALATVGLLASTLVGGLLVLLGRRFAWVRGGAVATVPAAASTGSLTAPPTPAPSAVSGAADPGVAARSAVAPLSAAPPPSATATPPGVAAQPALALPAAAALQPGTAAATPEATASPGEDRGSASGKAPEPGATACQASSTSAMPTERGALGLEPGASSPSAVAATAAAPPPLTLRSFAINLALTGSAVLIGVVMLEGLRWLAAWQGGLLAMVVDALPVFPLALLGSLLMRLLLERTGQTALVRPRLQARIGTLSADLLISAATACLDLSLLARDWLPLTVLATVGLVWNLAVILLLAPRILPASWFERGLVEFGQATGVAASGLLLLNMVDPEDRNGSLTPFSIKQLILQPFLAGGVITVVAPLAVTGWGLPAWSGFCFALVLLWIGLGLWLARSARAAVG